MKILGLTDLHLDGNHLVRANNKDGLVEKFVDLKGHQDDILLLGGDTCEVRSLRPHQMNVGGELTQPMTTRTMEDLKAICKAFKLVYAIVGNHEFYNNMWDETLDEFRALVKDEIPNLRILEKEVVEIEGVRIIATALWTDFYRGDAGVMADAKRNMNDYNLIREKYGFDDGMYAYPGNRLQPFHVYQEHLKCKEWLEAAIVAIPDDDMPTVVMTHHAPIMAHANPQRTGNSTLDYAYACTDMEKFLLDNEDKVALWFHGHTHDWKLTNVGNTIVATFARGYNNKEFKPQMLIDTE